MGGLPRRATIIESLQGDSSSPLFIADAGNFAWKSGRISDAALPQQQRKAEAILDAFAREPLDALGVGVNDLTLGVDWFKGAVEQRSIPATVANLTCGGAAPFPGHQVAKKGDVTVGFVGVFSDTRRVEGCEVSSGPEALRREIAAMGPVDMLVVFGHGSNEEDKALATAVPEIDLIINGHARVTRTSPEPLPNGAMQLGTGSRGKKLGIAEVVLVHGAEVFAAGGAIDDLKDRRDTFARRLESAQQNLASEDPAAKKRAERQVRFFQESVEELEAEIAELEQQGEVPASRLSVELQPLDRKVKDHPDVLALMEKANADISTLEAGATVEALTNTPYLGSAACSGCHSEIYQQWQGTRHAQAYATLQVENRENDRACYACHVTGAFSEDGPKHPAQVTLALQAVGCESCHGPGREHVLAPAADGKVERSPPEPTCVQCHDGVQDEGRFDYPTYLPKIAHQHP